MGIIVQFIHVMKLDQNNIFVYPVSPRKSTGVKRFPLVGMHIKMIRTPGSGFAVSLVETMFWFILYIYALYSDEQLYPGIKIPETISRMSILHPTAFFPGFGTLMPTIREVGTPACAMCCTRFHVGFLITM